LSKRSTETNLDETINAKTLKEIKKAIGDAKLLIADTINSLETEFGLTVRKVSVFQDSPDDDFRVFICTEIRQEKGENHV